MGKIIIPENYEAKLDLQETEIAIKLIKDTFDEYFNTITTLCYSNDDSVLI